MRFVATFAALTMALAATAAAADALHSAARHPDETYGEAAARYRAAASALELFDESGSAQSVAAPFSTLEVPFAPEYASVEALTEAFEFGRDARFLETDGSFLRRASWLYPDDGCFARAQNFGKYLETNGYKRPAKLFIFGSLRVNTSNSPDGYVSWWYHVVPVARVGSELYVMDPAIDPTGPMKARDWALTQVGDVTHANFSLCNEYTYSPGESCRAATSSSDSRTPGDQGYYLDAEWQRQRELGRSAPWFLGEHPPWKG